MQFDLIVIYEKYQNKVYSLVYGILVFVFVLALNRFISMIFVLNFSTAGLNASILLVLLFFNFPYTMLIKRISLDKEIIIFGNWIFILLFSAIMIIQQAIIATIASAIVLSLTTYLLLIYQTLKSNIIRSGLFFGLVMVILQYFSFSGTNLFGTNLGNIIFIIILIATALILINFRPVDIPDRDKMRTFSIITLLILFSIFLGAPYVISAWTYPSEIGAKILGLDYQIFTVLINLSIISSLWGVWAYYDKFVDPKYIHEILIILILVTFADIIWLSIIPVLSLLIVEIGFIFLTFSKMENSISDANSFKLFVVQFILILLIFLQVSAGNWAFLPNFIGRLTRGNAGLFLYLFMITHIAIFVLERRFQHEK